MRAWLPSRLYRADVEELESDGTGEKLRAIAATLTPEEHDRLAAEATRDDKVAQLVVAVSRYLRPESWKLL